MVDISVINPYLTEVTHNNISFIEQYIANYDVDSVIEKDFVCLDCTRVNANGMRLMQTIGFPYMKIITELVYIINNYIEDKDSYFIRLLELHNKNLEYEKINPPIWYGGEKAKRKFESSIKKKSTKSNKSKEKGPSAAERKLAAKVAKINALNFKIKSQN